MQKNKSYLLFLGLIINHLCFGQARKVIVPFELTAQNNISVKAILNEVDSLNLMFQTAANSLTITEDATKRLRSVSFNKTIEGIKSWGGSSNEARVSEHNTLQIGNLKWNEIEISENKNSGQNTDGKFGVNLFNDNVIKIDFDKKVLVISKYLPKKRRKYTKLRLLYENEMMFVEANSLLKSDKQVKNKFLIHSGYSGGVLFDDKFVEEQKLNEILIINSEKELKDSYGNILKTKKAILPAFNIGEYQLLDVPVAFFTGAIGRQKMSVLGAELIKRFNWIIDAKREFIYLKANRHFKEALK